MKNKRLFTTPLILFLLLLTMTGEALAIGSLFSRPRWSSEQYGKMWIQRVDVDVSIRDQIAVTHVDQTFYNEMVQSVEGVYVFPLPENAMVTELVYWVDGERYVADLKEREKAVREYNEKLRQWLDPALLEYLGDNMFRLKIVPIPAESPVRTEITYVELLDYDFGTVDYTLLLNTVGLSSKPLEKVSVDLDARSQTAFKSFQSPTYEHATATEITRHSDHRYTLFFGDENFYPDTDLVVEFETVREGVDIHVHTYTPVPKDSFGTESFYALWITPPDQVAEEKIIPKDIVFATDVSSSMSGERIYQVKEALNGFLDMLEPRDRFNIITFGTFLEDFRTDLVPANAENLSGARDFVHDISAAGLTNIDEALTTSLTQSYRDTSSNNLIFLTDGYPTIGVTQSDSILAHTGMNNTKDVRIFPFGIGENVSRSLLTRLGRGNHGYATYITSNDSIAVMVENHFTRISKPVLTDLSVTIPGLNPRDTYPRVLTDLFWGTQVMRLGRYTSPGTFQVNLGGDTRSDTVTYTKQVTFPDTAGGHRFVPRLWAKAKINYLMELIGIHGEEQELVDQVVDLSLRYGVLTPYTAFYIDPEENEDPGRGGTDITDKSKTPQEFALHPNYPNPFNPSTTIIYQLPADRASYDVRLVIYDVRGRMVATLVSREQSPGNYSVQWNGRDQYGKPVSSGMYFYTLTAGDYHQTRKMILMR